MQVRIKALHLFDHFRKKKRGGEGIIIIRKRKRKKKAEVSIRKDRTFFIVWVTCFMFILFSIRIYSKKVSFLNEWQAIQYLFLSPSQLKR